MRQGDGLGGWRQDEEEAGVKVMCRGSVTGRAVSLPGHSALLGCQPCQACPPGLYSATMTLG